jgi:hypothetical protein
MRYKKRSASQFSFILGGVGFIPFIRQFWTYSLWSLQLVVMFPRLLMVLAVATVSLVFSCIKQIPFQSPQWKRSHWLVLTQLLFFPIVISIGVLYPAASVNRGAAVSTANKVSQVLGWLSLVLAVYWIYRMKGLRWFAASLVLLIQVILMGAFFISGMAVSGDWL